MLSEQDYSFDAARAAYADWDHVTVYASGALVWGREP
jgi:cellulose 1,4-beta-cellobiosidase